MNRTDAPAKQAKPFGINGQREPLLPNTPAGDNTASYDQGFPPITMILKSAGGLPPKGQDMNQILFELSALGRWSSSGAVNTYDSAFATAIGGYPSGALLISNDVAKLYINTVDSNVNDPNTSGSGWEDLLSYLGATSVGVSIITAPTITELLNYLGITSALDGKQPLNDSLTSLSNLEGSADKLPYFTAANTLSLTDFTSYGRGLTSAPNQTDARSYLGLGSTSTRNVGNGSGDIPDMTYWTGGGNTDSGWRKTPDGYIEQWGITGGTTTDVFINFPIPFPSGVISINEHDAAESGETRSMWQFQAITNSNVLAQNIGSLTRGSATFNAPVVAGCRWFAKGK